MDSSSVDLNGLRALQILLREKHVSRAARLANLSQPAMSRMLARLREAFDDDLLVRGPRGYELTVRALTLREPVDRILDEVASLQRPPSFSAALVSEQITLAALDVELQLFVPYLFKRMRRESPHASMRTLSFSNGDFRVLDTEHVDFVITAFPSANQHYRRRLLYGNEHACVMSSRLATHLDHMLTLERYVAMTHGLVSFEDRGTGLVDTALSELGLSRRISLRVPGFLQVPAVCAASDVVFTLPTRIAQAFPRSPKLTWLPAPLTLPGIPTFLFWHPRNHLSPRHQWFREMIFDCATEIEKTS